MPTSTMESDEFSTPLSLEGIKSLKVPEDDAVSIVPLKRKSSVDLSEEASHFLTAQDAQRAHLARSAPHLFESNGINGGHHLVSSPASPASNSTHHTHSRSPSYSARPSPNPSDDEAGETSEAGASGNRGITKSRHAIPKGFRGPPPRLNDPELIAPLPMLTPIAGSNLFNTHNHPCTRNGYNYIAAGPATDHLPTSVYRTLLTEPQCIHWSWSDRSSFTHISADATIVSSDQGFRSARANVPIREGQWYVELHILPLETITDSIHQGVKDGPHVRLGWGRREAGLNAPVGINGYSYGMRDTTGEKVFLSRNYQYGCPFGPGDVVGMYISLPKVRKVNPKDLLDPARINRKRIPIRYKGRLYFEAMDYPVSKEMEHLMDRSRRGEKLRDEQGSEESVNAATGMLVQPVIDETSNLAAAKKKRKSAPGQAATPSPQSNNLRSMPTLGPDSQIGFFINGQPQGIAFENLLDFRPLRRQATATVKKSAVKTNATSSLGLSQGCDNDASIITTSSSLASILKSRENPFDDGSLGYFPFVSLFGGAKVQIVSQASEFRFPPPVNVRKALEEADRLAGRARGEMSSEIETQCRPMEDRYEEYFEELWKNDLADEEKAKEAAKLFQDNTDQDNEEEEVTVAEVKSSSKSTSKKSKKRNTPSRNDSPRMASTPLRDEIPINGHGLSSMSSEFAIRKEEVNSINVEEDEHAENGIIVKREEGEDTPMQEIENFKEEAMQVDVE